MCNEVASLSPHLTLRLAQLLMSSNDAKECTIFGICIYFCSFVIATAIFHFVTPV